MNKRIVPVTAGLFLLVVSLFTTCSNVIQDEDVQKNSDRTLPVIVITSPSDGDSYGTTVLVTGTINDFTDDGAPGRIDSVQYSVTGTALSGNITLAANGSFSVSIPVTGLTGTISLSITATDWNGNRETITIALVPPKEFTWFAFPALLNPVLDEDVAGTIGENTVSIDVPDGTDISGLVASFEIFGTSVTVGGIGQVSGVTRNDFRDPVIYVVAANDGTTKPYTVTVSEGVRSADLVAPLIEITSHANNDPYSSNVTVEGFITDEAFGGAAGQITEAEYELVGKQISGTISPGDDGSFTFQFSTTGLTGTIPLNISATDWNGNEQSTTINLVAPKEITWFGFLVEENERRLPWGADDINATITGTEIHVDVPIGTSVTMLVASFTHTGTLVKIGIQEQVSGETVNDFTEPQEYIVTGNDGSIKTYTVTVLQPLTPPYITPEIQSATEIELNWTDFSNYDGDFELQRKTGIIGVYETITTVDSGITTYLDQGLSPGTEYYYRIREFDGDSQSAWSTEQRAVSYSFLIDIIDDSYGSEFHPSIVQSTNGDIHVSFWTYGDDNDVDLQYAHFDGNSWSIELVDEAGTGGANSNIALDSMGTIHIGYCDTTNKSLKYATYDGSFWSAETIDSDNVIGWSVMKLDSNGYPHFCYIRTAYGSSPSCDLKYAVWNGLSWDMEIISSCDPMNSEGYYYTSMALDSANRPHISYSYTYGSTTSDGGLMYAHWNGSSWQIEEVDAAHAKGEHSSIAVDSTDTPHISFNNLINSALFYAVRNKPEQPLPWTVDSFVDNDPDYYTVGVQTALAIDSSDRPHIFYGSRTEYGTWNHVNAHIRHAAWDGNAWQKEYVDDDGGDYPAVFMDSSDKAHLCYRQGSGFYYARDASE